MNFTEKKIWVGLFVPIFIIWVVITICGITTSASINDTMELSKGMTARAGLDVTDLFERIVPLINVLSLSFATAVTASIPLAIDSLDLTSTLNIFVQPAMTLVKNMAATGLIMDSFVTNGQLTTAAIASVQNDTTFFANELDSRFSSLKNLSTKPVTTLAGGNYSLNGGLFPAIPSPASSLFQMNLSSLPSISDYMKPFLPPLTPNLTIQSKSVETELNSATQLIRNQIVNSSSGTIHKLPN